MMKNKVERIASHIEEASRRLGELVDQAQQASSPSSAGCVEEQLSHLEPLVQLASRSRGEIEVALSNNDRESAAQHFRSLVEAAHRARQLVGAAEECMGSAMSDGHSEDGSSEGWGPPEDGSSRGWGPPGGEPSEFDRRHDDEPGPSEIAAIFGRLVGTLIEFSRRLKDAPADVTALLQEITTWVSGQLPLLTSGQADPEEVSSEAHEKLKQLVSMMDKGHHDGSTPERIASVVETMRRLVYEALPEIIQALKESPSVKEAVRLADAMEGDLPGVQAWFEQEVKPGCETDPARCREVMEDLGQLMEEKWAPLFEDLPEEIARRLEEIMQGYMGNMPPGNESGWEDPDEMDRFNR